MIPRNHELSALRGDPKVPILLDILDELRTMRKYMEPRFIINERALEPKTEMDEILAGEIQWMPRGKSLVEKLWRKMTAAKKEPESSESK